MHDTRIPAHSDTKTACQATRVASPSIMTLIPTGMSSCVSAFEALAPPMARKSKKIKPQHIKVRVYVDERKDDTSAAKTRMSGAKQTYTEAAKKAGAMILQTRYLPMLVT